MSSRVIIGVDIGGTFTDAVLFDQVSGRLEILKILTNVENPEDNVVEILNRFNVDDVTIVHAGTLASNTLLGQVKLNLPKICLITNRGFRDILYIARQNRSELYTLKPRRPKINVDLEIIEIDERTLPDGRVEKDISDEDLDSIIEKLKVLKPDIVAICLLNSYVNPRSEIKIKNYIKSRLNIDVICSHEVVPICKEYERFSTTLICSILRPVISKYIDRLMYKLSNSVRDFDLYLVASWGGLIDFEECLRRPVILLESGPAAGVVACLKLCKVLDMSNVVAFDMGGTTAKFSPIVNKSLEIVNEYEINPKIHGGRVQKRTGIPIIVDMVDIVEVSAGGGTIIWVDEAGMLRVGPVSAGADPGPACYGRGGEKPTITDANVVLNRIYHKYMLGNLKISRELAYRAIKKISDDIGMSIEEVAINAIRKINFEMSRGIKIATVERGYDPREFTLVAYGGAGPLHACELANELEISKILIPKSAGVFTALGLACMDIIFRESIPIYRILNDLDIEEIKERLSKKSEELVGKVYRISKNVNTCIEYILYLRYRDQDIEIPININLEDTVDSILKKFEIEYSKLFGYTLEDLQIEITRACVVVTGMLNVEIFRPIRDVIAENPIPESAKLDYVDVFVRDSWHRAPILARDKLEPGCVIYGPAVIVDKTCTVFDDGWKAFVDCYGNIQMVRI